MKAKTRCSAKAGGQDRRVLMTGQSEESMGYLRPVVLKDDHARFGVHPFEDRGPVLVATGDSGGHFASGTAANPFCSTESAPNRARRSQHWSAGGNKGTLDALRQHKRYTSERLAVKFAM